MGNKKKADGLTFKQQLFAQYLFTGMSQREAYLAAGYSPNQKPATLDHHACVLADSANIVARLEQLRREADDEAIATVTERKKVLTEIIRGRIRQYTNGKRINVELQDMNSAAVSEVVTSELQIGKGDEAAIIEVTKLKLRDPIAAITELNKMDKVYTEQPPTQDNRTYNILVADDETKEEVKRLIGGKTVAEEQLNDS